MLPSGADVTEVALVALVALVARAVAGAARLPMAKTAATAVAMNTRLRRMFPPRCVAGCRPAGVDVLRAAPASGQHLSAHRQNAQFLITPIPVPEPRYSRRVVRQNNRIRCLEWYRRTINQ